MTRIGGKIKHLRQSLNARIRELERESKDSQSNRATVTLDQQSVGRLSRMDAMQQQAMANATNWRREQEILRIKATLLRIEAGEFGYCLDCGEAIEPKRLNLNPTVARCMSCVQG